ncbi:hypothetical protein KFU94_08790 [Chloroflexi bacterium TSY]|nr:hypothetical protein [Chloroflexi bacterium TSY]
MIAKRKKLWRCPKCGETFTTPHQWHSCGRFSLDDLFTRSEPTTRQLFDRFVKLVEDCGPVKVIPQKTRIAFQARMRFAAIMPRKHYLSGHFVLARHREEPFSLRIQQFSQQNYVHEFRLDNEEQLSDAFLDCIREAYNVGQQRHLDQDV